MRHDPSFDALWSAPAERGEPFDPERLSGLPEPARRYLTHAIAPGTRAASAVKLRMKGEIKLDAWCPFEAEEVIRWDRGFVWQARVRMHGLPITGSDRYVDGAGEMRWKLLGLLPVVTAAGPDVSRSALARVQDEAVWLPSVLVSPDVIWESGDDSHFGVTLRHPQHPAHVDLVIDETGRLVHLAMRRWGNPEGGPFHEGIFGGHVVAERTFEGFTVPSEVRLGWHVGTDRFASEGEFFRATVEDATYR